MDFWSQNLYTKVNNYLILYRLGPDDTNNYIQYVETLFDILLKWTNITSDLPSGVTHFSRIALLKQFVSSKSSSLFKQIRDPPGSTPSTTPAWAELKGHEMLVDPNLPPDGLAVQNFGRLRPQQKRLVWARGAEFWGGMSWVGSVAIVRVWILWELRRVSLSVKKYPWTTCIVAVVFARNFQAMLLTCAGRVVWCTNVTMAEIE